MTTVPTGQPVLVRLDQGKINAIWGSILAMHVAIAAVVIRLVPEQDPRSVGIAHRLRGRSARILRRDGMQYALRILRTDDQTLARAFAEQSGGRVTIR